MKDINIFIFRRDLRVVDNLALNALAQQSKTNILPIFIFNPDQIYAKNNPYFSNNAVQFMIESLKSLEKSIFINYYEGNDIEILESLHKKHNIINIAFNKDYTPFAIKRDTNIIKWCNENNINIITAEDYTLYPIASILTKTKKPYQVFTPFYRATLKEKVAKPTKNVNIDVLKIVHNFDKDKYYHHNEHLAVKGGRENALQRLKIKMNNYQKNRDYPALDSTTKMSAYIKFGCISIREVYYNYIQNKPLLRELIWREFYANILYQFPHVIGNSFKKKYSKIKWNNNKEWFEKWCNGETGYALVDAGMKQLNTIGWMHNRVRMIVAMFLTKDLLIDWRWGEKYFATKLIDYDPASNNGGWQWSASTGTDSQPYFRIFNPELQIKKYDKNYEYIKKWNPDYANKKKIVDHKERAKIAIKVFKKTVSTS
jgi:deoxyribodipyrimidine photo-lyase